MRKINRFFIPLIAIMILMPIFAFGATIKRGEEVSIKKGDDIRDNLYVAGGNVSLGSIIFGDLLVAGGNILISETVSEDIFAVGGTVTILGDTGGDVRVVGGNVLITGDIVGELIVAGGSVVVSPDVSIGKDLIVTGGQISIDGNVLGDMRILGGTATINGRIKGNVKAKIKDKLTIGNNAIINGNLEYKARSKEVLQIEETATINGKLIFTENKFGGAEKRGIRGLLFAIIGAFTLFKLLAFIITALILFWLFDDFSNSVVENVAQSPLRMLGKGFVVLVVAPVAAVILFATLLGAPFGFIIMFLYGLFLVISAVYAGVVAGAWAEKVIRKNNYTVITWRNIIGGSILLAIIGLVPILGWLVVFLVWLATLGSIVDIAHKKLQGER